MVTKIIEATFVLIVVFLLVTNGSATANVINSLTTGYARAVGTLQGRTVA